MKNMKDLNTDVVKEYWKEDLFPILSKYEKELDLNESWLMTKARYSKWSIVATVRKRLDYSQDLIDDLNRIIKELVDYIDDIVYFMNKDKDNISYAEAFEMISKLIELDRALTFKETLDIDRRYKEVINKMANNN